MSWQCAAQCSQTCSPVKSTHDKAWSFYPERRASYEHETDPCTNILARPTAAHRKPSAWLDPHCCSPHTLVPRLGPSPTSDAPPERHLSILSRLPCSAPPVLLRAAVNATPRPPINQTERHTGTPGLRHLSAYAHHYRSQNMPHALSQTDVAPVSNPWPTPDTQPRAAQHACRNTPSPQVHRAVLACPPWHMWACTLPRRCRQMLRAHSNILNAHCEGLSVPWGRWPKEQVRRSTRRLATPPLLLLLPLSRPSWQWPAWPP